MRIEIRLTQGPGVSVDGQELAELEAAVLVAKRDGQLVRIDDATGCRHLVNPEQLVELVEQKEDGTEREPAQASGPGITDDLRTMPT